MIKEVLNSINGVAIFPVVGLILFFPLFIGVVYYAFKMDKKKVDKLSNLPLEDDKEN
ncbi:MAG: cbb3-type cytochrome c oxidase subunit 3 [Ignavibacteriaceae bacterium]|nr:cbb3-type cytochrome c oxidase subunit 3 [Ignavibacteriaceae bacterium]NUM69756.1 cbb3-type cytochrome c oxidase subunit 3 [Ignavibacteriaceae bacterium]